MTHAIKMFRIKTFNCKEEDFPGFWIVLSGSMLSFPRLFLSVLRQCQLDLITGPYFSQDNLYRGITSLFISEVRGGEKKEGREREGGEGRERKNDSLQLKIIRSRRWRRRKIWGSMWWDQIKMGTLNLNHHCVQGKTLDWLSDKGYKFITVG